MSEAENQVELGHTTGNVERDMVNKVQDLCSVCVCVHVYVCVCVCKRLLTVFTGPLEEAEELLSLLEERDTFLTAAPKDNDSVGTKTVNNLMFLPDEDLHMVKFRHFLTSSGFAGVNLSEVSVLIW